MAGFGIKEPWNSDYKCLLNKLIIWKFYLLKPSYSFIFVESLRRRSAHLHFWECGKQVSANFKAKSLGAYTAGCPRQKLRKSVCFVRPSVEVTFSERLIATRTSVKKKKSHLLLLSTMFRKSPIWSRTPAQADTTVIQISICTKKIHYPVWHILTEISKSSRTKYCYIHLYIYNFKGKKNFWIKLTLTNLALI